MENNKSKEKKKIKNSTKFTILAIILISIFCFAVTPITLQNDTYYTIKIGEHIQNNGIDMKDPFSWHENLEYTYPHWLYDLITYWIYAVFNMDGIYIATCILSCILGISLFITCKKLTKNEVIAFFITIAAIFIIRPYIAARAQLVTFILFVWTVYFIEKFLETKKKRYGIYLITISLLIANLHVATCKLAINNDIVIRYIPYLFFLVSKNFSIKYTVQTNNMNVTSWALAAIYGLIINIAAIVIKNAITSFFVNFLHVINRDIPNMHDKIHVAIYIPSILNTA